MLHETILPEEISSFFIRFHADFTINYRIKGLTQQPLIPASPGSPAGMWYLGSLHIIKTQPGEQSLPIHLHPGIATSHAAATSLPSLWDAFQGDPGPAVHVERVVGQPQHHYLISQGLSSTFSSCISERRIWGHQGGWGVPGQEMSGQLGTQGWMRAKPVPHLSGCSGLHPSCAETEDPVKNPWEHTL